MKLMEKLIRALGLDCLYWRETGAVTGPIMVVFLGMLTLVFGVILGPVLLDNAATAGANANIGSFSGAQSLNDLTPFVYYTVVILLGLGLIAGGGTAAIRKGRG